jgi:hypothetical protein
VSIAGTPTPARQPQKQDPNRGSGSGVCNQFMHHERSISSGSPAFASHLDVDEFAFTTHSRDSRIMTDGLETVS